MTIVSRPLVPEEMEVLREVDIEVVETRVVLDWEVGAGVVTMVEPSDVIVEGSWSFEAV